MGPVHTRMRDSVVERVILPEADKGQLAVEVFVHRLRAGIGQMLLALGELPMRWSLPIESARPSLPFARVPAKHHIIPGKLANRERMPPVLAAERYRLTPAGSSGGCGLTQIGLGSSGPTRGIIPSASRMSRGTGLMAYFRRRIAPSVCHRTLASHPFPQARIARSMLRRRGGLFARGRGCRACGRSQSRLP